MSVVRNICVLVIFWALPLSGAIVSWLGTEGEDWSEPSLWTGGAVPGVNDGVWMNHANTQATIATGSSIDITELVVARRVADVELRMEGGSLTTTSNVIFIGQYEESSGTLVLEGGLIRASTEFSVAVAGRGHFEMKGGRLDVSDHFTIGRYEQHPTSIGSVVFEKGVIECGRFSMNSRSQLDLKGGTLIIDGDRASYIEGLVASGQISSSIGAAIKVDYNETFAGKTCVVLDQAASDYFVAVDGDDTHPGTLELPFRTFEKARDTIAEERANGNTAYREQNVWIRGGQYIISEGMVLQGRDQSLIKWEPWQGEEVEVIAATPVNLTDFGQVEDSSLEDIFRPEAQGKIVELDLTSHGIVHTGPYPQRFSDNGGIIELIADGHRLPISRYPNGGGEMTMSRVLANGDQVTPATFEFSDSRHHDWEDAIDRGMWLMGYWRVVWQIDALRVSAMDMAANTVTFGVGPHGGIGSKYQRPEGSGAEPYWAVNLIEEIDLPGEWAIDFTTNKLYVWLPDGVESLWISDMKEPVFTLDEVSNVTLEGIHVKGGLGKGILIRDGLGNKVKGCDLCLVNQVAIDVVNGENHAVISNDLHQLGEGGIILQGGDLETREPAGHVARNNHIHHFGINKRVYSGAIEVGYKTTSIGMTVSHNLIHDTPHGGVYFGSFDNVFEYNELHRVCLYSNDMGGFYSYIQEERYPAGGNTIRYNLVCDSPNASGVYFDYGDPGVNEVYGNVLVGLDFGVLVKNSGDDHHVYDNIAMFTNRGFQIAMTPQSVVRRNISIDNSVDYLMSGASQSQLDANVSITGDPGFVSIAEKDFRLSESSVIFDELPDFNTPPADTIGLTPDDVRTVEAPCCEMILTDSGTGVAFPTKQSENYTLEWSTDLSLWTQEGLKTVGTGEEITLDATVVSPQCFFRVKAGLR